jgi:beta-glucosidase
MKNLFRTLSVSICFLLCIITVKGQSFIEKNREAKVDSLIKNMTTKEKLAQITGIRPDEIIVDGKLSIEKCREVIPHGIGHLCQFSSSVTFCPNELRDFVQKIQEYLVTETRTAIPAIFHEEAITGFAAKGATTFPQQIGMGCTWNPELITKNSGSTSKLMRSVGATYALSPMMDLARDAKWGRIEESYGEDAYLTSTLGLAFVKGLQGDNLRNGVAATTKHFAGYGAETDSEKEFYEDFLMPHEAVIKIGGVKSVMPSYAQYMGEAAVANKELLTKILRNQIGFDGVVVSDYGAINRVFTGHKQVSSLKMAAIKAINAGTDVELPNPDCFPLLQEDLQEKEIEMETINNSVKRILMMKAELGLLDENPVIATSGALNFDPPANRDLAYQSACQSVVLLKNEGILPLKSNVKKIALVGPNAANVYGLLGDYTYQSMVSFWRSWSFDKENPKLITLLEGLQNKIGKDVTISHERGCDWNNPLDSSVKDDGIGDERLEHVKIRRFEGIPEPNLENAIKISEESDVIIAAVGENIYLSGEGRDREGIKLPGEQEDFVKKLIATGKPVILVIFGGRPQVISEIEPGCAAVLQAWFPGEEAGNALADILLGNVNPSGKLCVTYPKSTQFTELNYKKGYPVENKPQYPFGFGLSFTEYEYKNLDIKSKAKTTDKWIDVSAQIENTGDFDGTEIVQLYISPLDKNSTMNPIQLKGFSRINLKKGEEKAVKFKISLEQFAEYKDKRWVINPGLYEIKFGASCNDIRLKHTIEITGRQVVPDNGRSVYFSENRILEN